MKCLFALKREAKPANHFLERLELSGLASE